MVFHCGVDAGCCSDDRCYRYDPGKCAEASFRETAGSPPAAVRLSSRLPEASLGRAHPQFVRLDWRRHRAARDEPAYTARGGLSLGKPRPYASRRGRAELLFGTASSRSAE